MQPHDVWCTNCFWPFSSAKQAEREQKNRKRMVSNENRKRMVSNEDPERKRRRLQLTGEDKEAHHIDDDDDRDQEGVTII